MELTRIGATGYPAAGDPDALFVLAHGAGAGQAHPFLVGMARALSERGIDVVTFDFPYIAAGRRLPDRAPVLEQAFRDTIAASRGWSRAMRLVIGGKSMGGRMATHLGAQALPGLAGICVLGYPLHPPGKPEQPRSAHLPAIPVPVLIVQGERDTFGTPQELAPVLATMQRPSLHVVRGGDHSLGVRGRTREDVQAEVVAAITGWVSTPP